VRDIPEGFLPEWVADPEWKVGGDGKKCRMKGCKEPSVAALRRKHRGRLWYYCRDHLYGRKIEEGVVKFCRLVEKI
jgi:hypothetical protein